MKKIWKIFLISALLLIPAFTVMAMDQEEFERIFNLDIAGLTSESKVLLAKKYPAEDWEAQRFPKYVYSSEAVETGYRIAVKEPELLRAIPCYCFCDAMGHRHLLHCFVKDTGTGKKRFDDHAVSCNICFGQAMLAFLWKEAGASDEEIRKGMERKFERLTQS